MTKKSMAIFYADKLDELSGDDNSLLHINCAAVLRHVDSINYDLVEALSMMLRRFGGATDKITPAELQAIAAIAKATGK